MRQTRMTMRNGYSKEFRKLGERGVATVEFALILPAMLGLIVGFLVLIQIQLAQAESDSFAQSALRSCATLHVDSSNNPMSAPIGQTQLQTCLRGYTTEFNAASSYCEVGAAPTLRLVNVTGNIPAPNSASSPHLPMGTDTNAGNISQIAIVRLSCDIDSFVSGSWADSVTSVAMAPFEMPN